MRALLLAVLFAGSALVACKGAPLRNDLSKPVAKEAAPAAAPVAESAPAPATPAAPVVEPAAAPEPAQAAVVTAPVPATRGQRSVAQGTRAGIAGSLTRKSGRPTPATAVHDPVAVAPEPPAPAAPVVGTKTAKVRPTMAGDDPWATAPAPAPAKAAPAAVANASADMRPYD